MIYLIHFSSPLKHARHYVGFVERAEGLDARIKKHVGGSGAKLTAAASRAGIEFIIARIWPNGDRNFERKLKNRKEGPDLCPICSPNAMNLANEQVSQNLAHERESETATMGGTTNEIMLNSDATQP